MGARERVTIVLILIALGLFQLLSGLILYFTPSGRGYRGSIIYGLEKHVWKDLHLYISLIITVVVLIHLALNWRMFKYELKNLFR